MCGTAEVSLLFELGSTLRRCKMIGVKLSKLKSLIFLSLCSYLYYSALDQLNYEVPEQLDNTRMVMILVSPPIAPSRCLLMSCLLQHFAISPAGISVESTKLVLKNRGDGSVLRCYAR